MGLIMENKSHALSESPIAAVAIADSDRGVRVLPTVLAHAWDVAFDIARIQI